MSSSAKSPPPKHHWLHWLPVVLFVALGLWYSLAIPLGEGPDEPGHAEYAFWLARTGRLPNSAAGEVPGEGHQPPLAYWLYKPLALLAPAEQRYVQLRPNPAWSWSGGSAVAAFSRRSLDRWPFADDTRAWHAMRALSVLLGAITLVLLAQLAQRLELAPQAGWLALLLAACWPQMLFHSALVSNDPLLWLLCTLTLTLLLTPQPGHAWGLALGVAVGAALLTKQSALLLLPLVALGWWLRRRELARPWRQLGAMALSALLVAGWWYWRNWQLYGDPLGLGAYQQSFTSAAFDWRSATAWLNGLRELGASLIARLGWMNLAAPGWIIGLGLALAALGAAGWLRKTPQNHRWGLVAALPALALAWTSAFVLLSGVVGWQGRFVLPGVAALALLIGRGLAHWPHWLTSALLAAWLLAAIWLPAHTLPAAYAAQTSAIPQPAPALLQRWTPDHTPAFELRELALSSTALAPGTTLEIRTLWQATGPQDRAWSQFWHLALPGSKTEVVAFNRQPQDGAFPALQWTRGDWWRDTATLPMPATLPPGTYELRLGWYDEFGTQQRVGLRNLDGVLLGDYAVIATITITQ